MAINIVALNAEVRAAIDVLAIENAAPKAQVLALSQAIERYDVEFHHRVIASIRKGARRCEHRFKL